MYGADGTRRKKIENFAPGQSCDAPTSAQPVTFYFNGTEIRNFGQSNAEEILYYPTPVIRISKTKDAGGAVVTKVSTLHRDALGSVRAVTTAAGLKAERAVYRPHGEEQSQSFDLVTAPETKGFIGERFDAEAGLNTQTEGPTSRIVTNPGKHADAVRWAAASSGPGVCRLIHRLFTN